MDKGLNSYNYRKAQALFGACYYKATKLLEESKYLEILGEKWLADEYIAEAAKCAKKMTDLKDDMRQMRREYRDYLARKRYNRFAQMQTGPYKAIR